MREGMRLALRDVPVTRDLTPRRHRRGFTLTESLAVLAMISVIIVAASPTFIRLMRDRRVNRAAMHLVDYYRTGRTRAVGRGLPMLVVWDTLNGQDNAEPGSRGLVRLIEPNVVVNSTQRTCVNTDFTDVQAPGTAGVSEVSRVDFKSGPYTNTTAVFLDDGATPTARTYAEICFAPTGRAFIRFSNNGTFRPMTGVASFTVTNADTGLARTVFIPPSGVARLQL